MTQQLINDCSLVFTRSFDDGEEIKCQLLFRESLKLIDMGPFNFCLKFVGFQ